MGDLHLALQPRLQAIAGLVPQGTRLVDVGTDHGYLPIWLLQNGRIAGAIATDIGALPLERGRSTAAAYGMVNKVTFRLCDGLADVSSAEVDTIVIAGMGGETISGILDAAAWSMEKTLLLQPMSRAELLRPWLAEHGYIIRHEELVLDKGYIYPILVCTGGIMPQLTTGERYYGLSNTEEPLFRDYLKDWINRIQRAVDGLRRSDDQAERLAHMEKVLLALQEKENSLCVL